MIAVRPARGGEAASLTALCVRSKAHWGYDAAFMRLSAEAITVSESDITVGRVLVATDDANRTIGLVRVEPDGETADLGLMFVDPPAIGRGAGRRLTILADPHAAPFYERMGARFVRNAPSDAIPGRTLPFYEYDLLSLD